MVRSFQSFVSGRAVLNIVAPIDSIRTLSLTQINMYCGGIAIFIMRVAMSVELLSG
jgi:hypothetical protein